jgi:hypothetical protein
MNEVLFGPRCEPPGWLRASAPAFKRAMSWQLVVVAVGVSINVISGKLGKSGKLLAATTRDTANIRPPLYEGGPVKGRMANRLDFSVLTD